MFDIISSGSNGNCLIIDGVIAVDLGVSLKAIEKYIPSLKLVLLTHTHTDHLNIRTAKNLQNLRPSIRFCGMQFINLGVKNFDILDTENIYNYGLCSLKAFNLYHNVFNVGWKIQYKNKKIIYATDTNRIDHIQAKNYDYYFIEANHKEDEIKQIIEQKKALGLYSYEMESIYNHLSKEKCDKWLLENLGDKSEFTYMHISKGKVDIFE